MSITDAYPLSTTYRTIAQTTVEEGSIVKPRGYETRELLGVTMAITDLPNSIPIGCGRDLKPNIAAAEALLLCGGIGSASLLISTSSAFQRFLDGGQLHGAYGPRVRSQIPRVVERLKNDPDSRQSFVSIWDPAYDQDDTRDLPCTVSFNFHIREGRLVMHSHMRSQDVFLGLPYDVFFFGQLGMTIARALKLDPCKTTLVHHVDSFHAYARNFDAIAGLHDFKAEAITESESTLEPDLLTGFGLWGGDIRDSMERARQIYMLDPPGTPTASEQWYIDQLGPLDRLIVRENFAS